MDIAIQQDHHNRRASLHKSSTSDRACKLCMLMAGLILLTAISLFLFATLLDFFSLIMFASLWMFGAGITLLLISYFASDSCQRSQLKQ